MTITPAKFWSFLRFSHSSYEEYFSEAEDRVASDTLTPAEYAYLARQDIIEIVAGQLDAYDGDTVVDAVVDAITTMRKGYKIVTWYGTGGETLVAGYKGDFIAE